MGRTLITGASAGIGAAIADVCAREGHDLILVARRSERLAARAAELERTCHVRVSCFSEDLSAPGGASRLYQKIIDEGLEVENLVNNAGVGLYGPFSATDLDRELSMIQLNVTSLVELTKRCLPAMIEQRRGRILNVASTAAFVPGPLMSVYYATKACVLSFSEAIGYELRGTGVTVTTLCPGPTESEFKVRAGAQRSRLFSGRGPQRGSRVGVERIIMDAAAVARAGYTGMMAGKSLVVPGLRNKVIPVAARLLPRSVMKTLSYRAAKE